MNIKCQIKDCENDADSIIHDERIIHGIGVNCTIRHCGKHSEEELEETIKNKCEQKIMGLSLTNPYLEAKKVYGMGKAVG